MSHDPVIEIIYSYIEKMQTDRKQTNANRCSAATMCVRRRWYQNKGYPGEILTARKLLNFAQGDIAELNYKSWIERACMGTVYSEVNFGVKTGEFKVGGTTLVVHDQPDLHLKIGPLDIIGHPDGLGKRVSDGKWELIEFKSASSYGFDEFVENGPGDYLKQAHALMLTDELLDLKVASVRFFFFKKETGEIASRLYEFDPAIAQIVKTEFLESNGEAPPVAPYGFVEKKMDKTRTVKSVPWQCGYCPYLKECKGEHTVEFKSGKPVYVFN